MSPNLNVSEIAGLSSLSKRSGKEIIIVPADKGGGICVFSRDDYLKEGYKQLNDTNTYQELKKSTSSHIVKAVEDVIQALTEEKHCFQIYLQILAAENPPPWPFLPITQNSQS